MYSIGQLAKIANVSNRTLRYYEELGLISPNSRGENRYRYYDDSHLQRLHTIKMLQESGFALKEIVAALQPQLDPNGQITYSGKEVANKIYKALEAQSMRLIERQKEVALAIDEIQRTMKSLTECFGCAVGKFPEECLKCDTAPREVVHLSRQYVETKAANALHLNGEINNGNVNPEAIEMRNLGGSVDVNAPNDSKV